MWKEIDVVSIQTDMFRSWMTKALRPMVISQNG